jgi:hypothetical protein
MVTSGRNSATHVKRAAHPLVDRLCQALEKFEGLLSQQGERQEQMGNEIKKQSSLSRERDTKLGNRIKQQGRRIKRQSAQLKQQGVMTKQLQIEMFRLQQRVSIIEHD